MPWYAVSAITLMVYWAISLLILLATKESEDVKTLLATGFVYVLLYILFYPVRAWDTYTYFEREYRKHGITRWQYIFGKRPPKRKVED